LNNYTNSVREAAKNNTNFRYANSTLEHAKVLTEELIKHSNKEICMVSDEFFDDFYYSIRTTIKNFLNKKDAVFKLIISKKGSKLAKELKANYPNNFLIKIVSTDKLPKDNETKETINYLINDTNGFRYEYSDKDAKNGLVKAIANFNSPDEREILHKAFDILYK
jgi:sugar-specific transcriptional regulator TrmB